jgi:hypothetical protein
MKHLIWLACVLSAAAFGQPSGELVFTFPLEPDKPQKTIRRNEDYFSIHLLNTYVRYDSGYLENVRHIVVVSDVTLGPGRAAPAASAIQTVKDVPRKIDDFIPARHDLALCIPATGISVGIHIQVRGIGDDKFKPVFDCLNTDGLLKTTLAMNAGTLGKVDLAKSLIERLLASPYSSQHPDQILNIQDTFTILPTAATETKALQSGYLLMLSSSRRRNSNLNWIQGKTPADFRVNPLGSVVEMRNHLGTFEPFTNATYALLVIHRLPAIGDNTQSSWWQKYDEATSIVRNAFPAPGDTNAQKALKDQSFALWREGNTVLALDQAYLPNERTNISWRSYKALCGILQEKGVVLSPSEKAALGEPPELEKALAQYDQRLQETKMVLAQADSVATRPDVRVTAEGEMAICFYPGFKIRPGRRGTGIIANLKDIDAAMGQWALENRMSGTNMVDGLQVSARLGSSLGNVYAVLDGKLRDGLKVRLKMPFDGLPPGTILTYEGGEGGKDSWLQ